MNLSRLVASFLPVLLSGALVTAGIPAPDESAPRVEPNRARFHDHNFDAAIPQSPKIYGHFVIPDCESGVLTCIVPTPTDGGIKEDIPAKYRDRYEKWKAELLSTDWGRTQWERYANDTTFVLKIVVSGDRKRGAGTDKLQWDDRGRFVGATITLGANPSFTLPALDFAAVAAGIDARKVVDRGILPVINSGIAHREPGVGQIGAGITAAPMACFSAAVKELAHTLQGSRRT